MENKNNYTPEEVIKFMNDYHKAMISECLVDICQVKEARQKIRTDENYRERLETALTNFRNYQQMPTNIRDSAFLYIGDKMVYHVDTMIKQKLSFLEKIFAKSKQ